MKYTYTVIKSKRKTYSIRITDDNSIIIRAPISATQKDIDRLIVDKKSWIDKILTFNENNRLNTPEIQSYKCSYVNGKIAPVIYDGKNFIDEKGVHVSDINHFQTSYVKGVGQQFITMFHEIENFCNLHAQTVKFRSYKSRWGCCDCSKNIVFNFKLLMLPIELQEYVIVHELCHIVYMNHSAQFWALVKKFLPHCAKLRKQLKDYNFIVKMY